MVILYKTKLEIKAFPAKFSPIFIQYDHARLEIELLDEGKPHDLTKAARVEFTHVRKDGLVIIEPGELVASNGTFLVCYEYKGSEMELIGKVKTSIAIFDIDGNKTSTHSFEVTITEDLRNEIFNPAEPNAGLLQELLSEIQYVKDNPGSHVPLNNTLTSDSTTEGVTAAIAKELNEKITTVAELLGHITNVGGNDLAAAIANTPIGGRLLLNNAATYTILSSITAREDIVIDGNNAKITTLGNAKINFMGNVEIYNTIFERAAISLIGDNKKVKINNNKFNRIYDNVIECWGSLASLIVKDNEVDGTFVSTGTNKNFNNSGSFVYLNGGKIDFLRIKYNRISNIRGGTAIFMSGNYPNLDIDDNDIDTIAQRAIGFWYNIYAKGKVSNNRIFRCGVLKAPGIDAHGEGAGVGCNAIYSSGKTYDVDVLDNHIEFVYENGIEGNFKNFKRNTIIGTGMDLVNYPTPSYEGIFIWFGKQIDIEDNTLINCAGNGIYGYTPTTNIDNVTVKRNNIKNDAFHNASAICFRTTSGAKVENIVIEDNDVNNYSTVIEIPDNKIYNNVKIGKQTATNYTTMLNDFKGSGIDIEGVGINRVNLIKNGNFNTWDSATGRFADWTTNNATLQLVTDTLKNSAKVTATDAHKGRIMQNVYGVANPEKAPNRFGQLVMRAEGNNVMLVRLYELDGSGNQVGTPLGLYVRGLTEDGLQTFKIKIPYLPSYRLELCNDGIATNWFEISEVAMYLIESFI